MDNREKLTGKIDGKTRRQVLATASPIFASLSLAACNQSSPEGVVPIPLRTASPTASSQEIKDQLPGAFSETIRAARLVPELFDEKTAPEVKLFRATSYMRRYVTALERQPQLRGKPLSTYLINKDNFPIAIPFSLGSDWNIWEFMSNLIKDVDSGKVGIIHDPNAASLAGQRSEMFLQQNGKWMQKTATISFGDQLSIKTLFWENQNQFYGYRTDLDIALIIIHEYAHALQGHHLIDFININPDLRAVIGQSENRFHQNLDRLIVEKNAEIARKVNLVNIKAHEAQANALSCMFLYSLNTLNQSRHFPGSVSWDPTPKHIEVMRRQGDSNYTSLYNLFEQNVLTGNALNRTWLQAAAAH